MKILAHRGYWNDEIERNSPEALRMALEKGFGFESDVRDYAGKMVISHNIADASCQDVKEVFKWLHEFGDKYTFAINIKADGLKHLLIEYLDKYKINNYFLFDMSVPQMIEFRDAGLRIFTRQSEIEPTPCMYNDAVGVWIDAFWDDRWITKELIENHLLSGKQVCIVSPDLHRRENYRHFWNRIRGCSFSTNDLILCTDHPNEARRYFNE